MKAWFRMVWHSRKIHSCTCMHASPGLRTSMCGLLPNDVCLFTILGISSSSSSSAESALIRSYNSRRWGYLKSSSASLPSKSSLSKMTNPMTYDTALFNMAMMASCSCSRVACRRAMSSPLDCFEKLKHLSSKRSMTCVVNLGMRSWMTRLAALTPLLTGCRKAPGLRPPAGSRRPRTVAACFRPATVAMRATTSGSKAFGDVSTRTRGLAMVIAISFESTRHRLRIFKVCTPNICRVTFFRATCPVKFSKNSTSTLFTSTSKKTWFCNESSDAFIKCPAKSVVRISCRMWISHWNSMMVLSSFSTVIPMSSMAWRNFA
mmetsp:Transcript_13798/g.41045  ORF Transcript_13798/g.41045 Transcript_13798/m.41045 type:complete len:319 (-) Transcript_13798:152-1108(-)